MGRLLIIAGAAILILGILLTFADRLPFRPGRLPGDIVYHGKHTTFFFPVVTCILLSIVLSLLLSLFSRR